MPDLFELLGQAARVAEAIPVCTRIGMAVKHVWAPCDTCGGTGVVRVIAATGEVVDAPCPCGEKRANAAEYLLRHGWREGLDVARPGLGSSIQQSIQRYRQAAVETRSIVGGKLIRHSDFAELPKPPWEDFARALAALSWGSIPIFGMRGGGKTQTMLRLGEVAAARNGYPVEAVNLWREDTASWVQPISADLLVKRMQIVKRALSLPHSEEELTKRDLKDARLYLPQLEAMRGRVILLDESSLADYSPNSPERKAVIAAMMNARHLDWIVLYAAQMMNQLPRSILTSDILMFKQPAGEEVTWDRDEPAARALWAKAAHGFETIVGDPHWWNPPYDDVRAWVYVYARAPVPYQGMMPVRLPTHLLEQEAA